jgi:hypothetical protein
MTLSEQEKKYKKIPQIRSFVDEQGNNRMKEEIEANYKNIKSDVLRIIVDEMDRISNDPDLQHLIHKN